MTSDEIKNMFQLNATLKNLPESHPQKQMLENAFESLHKKYIDEVVDISSHEPRKINIVEALSILANSCEIASIFENSSKEIEKDTVVENIEQRKLALKTIFIAVNEKKNN